MDVRRATTDRAGANPQQQVQSIKQEQQQKMSVAPVSKAAVLVKIGSWRQKSSHKVVPVVSA
jgi:hypothetical protein